MIKKKESLLKRLSKWVKSSPRKMKMKLPLGFCPNCQIKRRLQKVETNLELGEIILFAGCEKCKDRGLSLLLVSQGQKGALQRRW